MPSVNSGYVVFVDESVLDGSVEMFGTGGSAHAVRPSEAKAAATTAEGLPPEELLSRRTAILNQLANGIADPAVRIEALGTATDATSFGLPKIASSEPTSNRHAMPGDCR